ncbi:MAG: hypothetical protein KAI26_05775 [Nanoarchaeota archaeon]|nr:hypothetical protein [Nanoarchaeota archaeon]
MTSLIACLTSDSGTWEHVKRVIEQEEWKKIFLIANNNAADNFSCSKDVEFIRIDSNKLLPNLLKDISQALYGKIKDFEVAVNFISGSGKEHMAIMSAVLKLGLGIRLVILTKDGIKEL